MKTTLSAYQLTALVLGLAVSFPCFAAPDLVISKLVLTPNPPVQGEPVAVEVTTYNRGDSRSGPYVVQWWAGKNFPEPACTWSVDDGSNPKGGRVLHCRYAGYASWYGRLETVATVDVANTVREQNEVNNQRSMTIRVEKAGH
jgi:hypothetical protein